MNEPGSETGGRLAPTRLDSLDLIRGVAVMGILLMNIVDFAMPDAAYFNPRAYGGWHGANYAAFVVNFVLFDGKMRGLFSFLFGASMLIVIDAAEARGQDAARVHFSRMTWLLLFGLAHLWLLWDGDILSLYAPIGMLAWGFRKLPAHRLIVIAGLLIVAQATLEAGLAYDVHATELAVASPHPTAPTLERWRGYSDGFGETSRNEVARQLAVARSGYAVLTNDRFVHYPLGSVPSVLFVGLETLGYMLLGMALLRNGLLTGSWSPARYRQGASIGLAIGFAAYGACALYLAATRHSTAATILAVFAAPTPFRPFMIVGWACLILLLARPARALERRIAAAGRMAFTNYLATSLICTSLFYGYGFGWFGTFQRAELYPIVLLIWIAMLLWSQPWLSRFRYGPLEWLWRSLARGKVQPLRGSAFESAIENQTH